MNFAIYQESRKGARPNNQDRTGYARIREALLMIVADGVGGHPHGEVASQVAVRYLLEAFQREVRDRLADPFEFLQQNMGNAHRAIIDFAQARGLPETPRTTCVACVVQDATAYWGHVGDSRLYHVRDGRIRVRTKDHSRIQQMLDEGRIGEEAAAGHPDRNKIFNCLGAVTPPQVELSRESSLKPGDILFLCTDGLWGPLAGRAIGATLAGNGIMRAIPELLDAAELRAGGGCDNLSAVGMRWADDPPAVEEHTTELSLDMESSGKAVTEPTYLSDREIEQAIAHLRDTIRKHSEK